MGLPMCLGVVRAHGAALQVESAKDCGGRIRIYLARAEEEAASAAVPKQAPASGTVMVVDDDPIVRESIAEIVRRRTGRSALEAQNGREALAHLDAHGRGIGFVIMDAVLPCETGMEIFAQLRARDPELSGLLCSGYTASYGHEAALRHGFVGFLPKPFGWQDLSAFLEPISTPPAAR